ncbi:hypothetical protein [Methanobrevibacter sp.]|uniref:hypothetical protein n=1 Tax=Methanobrevibacter sp. TaxID=66852 RepID=UPI003869B957
MSINDVNHNGLLDVLEQQIQHASTSTISNFATVAKKASEIVDGANRCYFNKVNKCLVVKHGNKPMSECLQLNANHNTINNVESVHFKDETTIEGLIDSLSTELTTNEQKTHVPTIGLIQNVIDSIDPSHIYVNLDELLTKTHDISYSSNKTNIEHDLSIGGEIDCSWLNDELAKYALIGHNHDLTYSPLNHQHEFTDIYKQTTKTIINENTNEEEEITETKTLQEVLAEYEQDLTNLTSALNGKANVSHTHEISDIYKNIDDGEGNITQKSLETLINEKANSSHTHNATEINYNSNVNVKQELDSINSKIETTDSQGRKLNLLAVLFGAGAVAGTAIDGGLTAAVLNLQSQIATLSAAVTALQGANTALNATGNALDAIDDLGDLADLDLEDFDEIESATNSNWFKQFSNWLGERFNSHSGYMRASTTDNYWSSITNTTNFTGGSTSLLDLTGEIL